MRDGKAQSKGQAARAFRLRKARRKHFKSMRAAAYFHEWSVATLASHEKGARAFKYECAVKYAKAFCVDIDWLWNGREAESQRLPELASSAALTSREPAGRSVDLRSLENSESSLQSQMEALRLCQSMLAHTKELLELVQRAIEDASRLRSLNGNLAGVAGVGQDGCT